jgi:proline iminopeptidase
MVRDVYLSQDCNKANGNQDIVVRVCNDLEIFGFLTLPTLSVIDNNGGMDKNIIYAVLHESIYCQG